MRRLVVVLMANAGNQGLVDELLIVRGLSNAQLSQRLGVVIGEFLSRYR